MSTDIVKRNVKEAVKMWEEALTDAEEGLKKATREVRGWQQTIGIIRTKIANGAPWPVSQNQREDDVATRN